MTISHSQNKNVFVFVQSIAHCLPLTADTSERLNSDDISVKRKTTTTPSPPPPAITTTTTTTTTAVRSYKSYKIIILFCPNWATRSTDSRAEN